MRYVVRIIITTLCAVLCALTFAVSFQLLHSSPVHAHVLGTYIGPLQLELDWYKRRGAIYWSMNGIGERSAYYHTTNTTFSFVQQPDLYSTKESSRIFDLEPPNFRCFGLTYRDEQVGRVVAFPLTYVLPFTVAPILLFGWRFARKTRRTRQRLCPTCDYDLRAHKPGEKCPECGTPIPDTRSRIPDAGQNC